MATSIITGAVVSSSLASTASFGMVELPDKGELKFGDDVNLRIHHDGSNNYISNQTNGLYIRQNANNANIFIQSDDGSGGTTTYQKFDGTEESILFSPPSGIISGSSISTGSFGGLRIVEPINGSIIEHNAFGLKITGGSGFYPLTVTSPYETAARFLSSDGTAAIEIGDNSSTTDYNKIQVVGNSKMEFFVNNQEIIKLGPSGNTTIFNEDSLDINFRFEGADDTHLFYLDAGKNHATIGANRGNTGDEKLLVAGDVGITGSLHVSGNISTSGSIIAKEFRTEFINQIIATSSGSTQFGDDNADSHKFTGSLNVTGSNVLLANNTFFSGEDADGDDVNLLGIHSNNNVYVGPSTNAYAGGYVLYGAASNTNGHVWYEGDAERMRIADNGMVGIGTDSPGTKLEVKAAGDTSQEVIKIRNSSGTEVMTIAAIDSGGDGYINFNTSPGTINTNGGHLVLSPGGSGKVGIGTTAPGELLHVDGGIEFAGRKYYRGTVSVAGAGTANGQAITLSDELGTTLNVNYQYKITLNTIGTGTDTGAVYILTYDQDGGAWDLHLVSRNGSTSNHPLAVVDGSNLKAYHNHASTYSILYFVEFWDMSADDGTLHGWGADYQWTRDVDTLSYSAGDVNIDSGTFFVDASTNRVGLLDTSPDATLQIGSGTDGKLFYTDGLYNDVTFNGGSGGTNGVWEFVNSGTWAQTRFYVQDANNSADRLTFDFRGNGTNNKILAGTSTGNVGIGTTSPGAKLEVIGSISGSITSTGSFGALSIGHGTPDRPLRVYAQAADSNVARFSHGSSNSAIDIYTGTSGGLINVRNGSGTSTINIDARNDRINLADTIKTTYGTDNDLEIYHDDTNAVINNTKGDLQIYNNADDKDIVLLSDDGSGGTTAYLTLDGSTRNINVDIAGYMEIKSADGSEGGISLSKSAVDATHTKYNISHRDDNQSLIIILMMALHLEIGLLQMSQMLN